MDKFLINLYFRRYLSEGWTYLVLGIAIPLVLIAVLIHSGNALNADQISPLTSTVGLKDPGLFEVATFFPFLMPLFAVISSIMAPALYSEDRTNGFYEFILSSTSMGTRDIFWSIVLTAFLSSLIALAIIVFAVTVVFMLLNGSVPLSFARILGLYTVPITIIAAFISASIAFASEALTKKVSFVNSPAGMAPIIGVAVTLIPILISRTLFTGTFQMSELYRILAIYIAAALLLLIGIFTLTTRRMVRERFLS